VISVGTLRMEAEMSTETFINTVPSTRFTNLKKTEAALYSTEPSLYISGMTPKQLEGELKCMRSYAGQFCIIESSG
jgi:hypothetical protein